MTGGLTDEARARIEARLARAIEFTLGREPRYRYYQTSDGTMFIWTVERMGDDKYASAVYVPYGPGARSGKPTKWRARREVHHKLRRAAKARAYALYREHRAELAERPQR